MGKCAPGLAWSWWQGLEAGTGHSPGGPPRPGLGCQRSHPHGPAGATYGLCQGWSGAASYGPCSSAAMAPHPRPIHSRLEVNLGMTFSLAPRLPAARAGGEAVLSAMPSQHHVRLLPKHRPATQKLATSRPVCPCLALIRTVPSAWSPLSSLGEPAQLRRSLVPHV